MAASNPSSKYSLSRCLDIVLHAQEAGISRFRGSALPNADDGNAFCNSDFMHPVASDFDTHRLKNAEEQFSKFEALLLGREDDSTIDHFASCSSGSSAPVVSYKGGIRGLRDSEGAQYQQGASVIGPVSRPFWFPDYLKKREKADGYSKDECLDIVKPLLLAFDEVKKFDEMTDIAKRFAVYDIKLVEELLKCPKSLQATFKKIRGKLSRN